MNQVQINNHKISRFLWGESAQFRYLFIAAIILLFGMLGAKQLWTQEGRWFDISWEMIKRHDYLQPYLLGTPYFDKPQLSYWLMILLSHITGGLNAWSVRLPSALSGLFSIYCCYQIGRQLFNKQVGLIAGWLLLTTYYFTFWSRISSADMLNVAGNLLACLWYVWYRDQPTLKNYSAFFVILGVTSLLKGLLGVMIPLLFIMPDMLYQHRFKEHLKPTLLLALIPGIVIYLLPFWISNHFGTIHHYAESGLYEVFRENIVRYFHPFDQVRPWYLYFLYLPIYTLPWAFALVPIFCHNLAQWRKLTIHTRWLMWAVIVIFIFFTGCGSRRSYYILPLVPFAILLTAEGLSRLQSSKSSRYLARCVVSFLMIMALWFLILEPFNYSQGGLKAFGSDTQIAATRIHPWHDWHIIMLHGQPSVLMYLNPTYLVPSQGLEQNSSGQWVLPENLAAIVRQYPHTIIIGNQADLEKMQPNLKDNVTIVTEKPGRLKQLFHLKPSKNPMVAIIPNQVN